LTLLLNSTFNHDKVEIKLYFVLRFKAHNKHVETIERLKYFGIVRDPGNRLDISQKVELFRLL